MRFLSRLLFRTRNRQKALEEYLGVYFNDDWDEFEAKNRSWSENHSTRLKFLEDRLLSKKQKEELQERLRG